MNATIQSLRGRHLRIVPAAGGNASQPPDQSACVTFRLDGVRHEGVGPILRVNALQALLATLWTNEAIQITHVFEDGNYRFEICLLQPAGGNASDSRAAFPLAAEGMFPDLRFALTVTPSDALPPLQARFAPGDLTWSCKDAQSPRQASAPWPGSLPNWALTTPFLEPLVTSGERLALVAQLAPATLSPGRRAALEEALTRLKRGVAQVHAPSASPFRGSSSTLERTHDEALARMAESHWHALLSGRFATWSLKVDVHADTRLTNFALARLVHDIFGEHPVRVADPETAEHDLPPSWPLLFGQGFPGLVPARQCLIEARVPVISTESAVLPQAPGPTLGHTSMGTPLVLPDNIRSSHLLVVGSSGAGKSNLMRRLAIEEMCRGSGLIYIDPHGDDYRQLMTCVPKSRAGDVVLMDFEAVESSVSINPFTGNVEDPKRRQTVVNQLADLIDRQIETPESTGPRTRHAVRLVLELAAHHPNGGTLADCHRITIDRDFRDWLLTKGVHESLLASWKAFIDTEGESGYRNWLPYLEARFHPFTSTLQMHAALNRPATVDVSQLMKNAAIVLVKLPWGTMGPDASMLGAILLAQLQNAAMAGAARALSRPFLVFVDEFQSMINPSVASMFQALRKFNVGMCVATQSMDSLRLKAREDVATSVLANTAAKLFMRLSPRDAIRLDEYTAPEYPAATVARLPNFEAILSLPALGIPPIRFRSSLAQKSAKTATLKAVLAHQVRHAHPIKDVVATLNARHTHLGPLA